MFVDSVSASLRTYGTQVSRDIVMLAFHGNLQCGVAVFIVHIHITPVAHEVPDYVQVVGLGSGLQCGNAIGSSPVSICAMGQQELYEVEIVATRARTGRDDKGGAPGFVLGIHARAVHYQKFY